MISMRNIASLAHINSLTMKYLYLSFLFFFFLVVLSPSSFAILDNAHNEVPTREAVSPTLVLPPLPGAAVAIPAPAPAPAPVAILIPAVPNRLILWMAIAAGAMTCLEYFTRPQSNKFPPAPAKSPYPIRVASRQPPLGEEKLIALINVCNASADVVSSKACEELGAEMTRLSIFVDLGLHIGKAVDEVRLTKGMYDGLSSHVGRMELLAALVKQGRCIDEAKHAAAQYEDDQRGSPTSAGQHRSILGLYRVLVGKGEGIAEAAREAAKYSARSSLMENVAPALQLFGALVKKGHAVDAANVAVANNMNRSRDWKIEWQGLSSGQKRWEFSEDLRETQDPESLVTYFAQEVVNAVAELKKDLDLRERTPTPTPSASRAPRE